MKLKTLQSYMATRNARANMSAALANQRGWKAALDAQIVPKAIARAVGDVAAAQDAWDEFKPSFDAASATTANLEAASLIYMALPVAKTEVKVLCRKDSDLKRAAIVASIRAGLYTPSQLATAAASRAALRNVQAEYQSIRAEYDAASRGLLEARGMAECIAMEALYPAECKARAETYAAARKAEADAVAAEKAAAIAERKAAAEKDVAARKASK